MNGPAGRGTGDPLVREVALVGYLAAAVVLVDQLTQVVATGGGGDLVEPTGRIRAAVLLSSRVPVMALAGLIVVVVGELRGGSGPRRVGLGLLWALLGVLVLALGSLWFDGPRVRDLIPAGELDRFVVSWVRATAMAGLGLVLAGVAGAGARLGGFRRLDPRSGGG